MSEVFPLPAGPTRRNVGRVVVARELNINKCISKGVKKMTMTVAIKTGREGLKNEVRKELGGESSSGRGSGAGRFSIVSTGGRRYNSYEGVDVDVMSKERSEN